MTETNGKRIAIANVRGKNMHDGFNQKKYGKLLAETLPVSITDDSEWKRLRQIFSSLMKKGEHLSPEEGKLLELLAVLIEEYEKKKFPLEPLPPHIVLRTLLEENELRQKELIPIFRTEPIISEVLSGKRAIGKNKAKELAEFFHVSYKSFL